jgi:hypothetical protein
MSQYSNISNDLTFFYNDTHGLKRGLNQLKENATQECDFVYFKLMSIYCTVQYTPRNYFFSLFHHCEKRIGFNSVSILPKPLFRDFLFFIYRNARKRDVFDAPNPWGQIFRYLKLPFLFSIYRNTQKRGRVLVLSTHEGKSLDV